jgi:acetylornithine/succinyldiaminopimelate/putrescine aminotransferase
MRACYENGIWAIYSALDRRVLQFKPGLLADRELCDDILDRMETAVGKARTAALGDRPKARRPRGDKAKKLRKAA